MKKFELNDQVVLREQTRGASGGRSSTVVRLAKIVGFREGNKAEVAIAKAGPGMSCQGAPGRLTDVNATRRVVSIDSLEPVDKRFGGRKVVQANPIHRAIGSLIRQ